MKRIIVLFFATLILTGFMHGQSKTDSLVLLYDQISGSNRSEIDLLNELTQKNAASYPSIAELFARKALNGSKKINYAQGEAAAYLNFAAVFRTRSDLTKALENGFRAYRLFEQVGDSAQMASAYNSIGTYFQDIHLMDSALVYLRKALILNRADAKIKANTFNNIGATYAYMDLYDSAEWYYHKALDIREEIKDLYGLGITYGNLGVIAYQKDNDPELARFYYEKSLAMKRKNGDFFQMAYTYINLGNLHRNIGKYIEARKYYQTAIQYADSAEAKGVKASTYVRWARSERRAGNIELANEYDRLSSRLYIEVLEERQKSELEQLEASYQLAKKEQELMINEQRIALLEKDQKLLLIQLVALIFIAAFLIVLFLWYRTKARKNRELQQARQAKLESELNHKNNELSTFTINFIQKQEMMEELTAITRELKSKDTSEIVKAKVRELERIISAQQRNDKEWDNFRIYFEKVHTGFFQRLQADFDGLTITDLRLAALIKLNLSIKETASVLGIAPGSVKTSRYRLRVKLGIDGDESLLDFLSRYNNSN